jgi:hypothetical protein
MYESNDLINLLVLSRVVAELHDTHDEKVTRNETQFIMAMDS